MLKVGLTGGIGVGKTTVSDLFEKLGVPVIDTDVIAHEIVFPGSPAQREIVNAFGEEILTDHRKLDRKLLGKIVFSNPAKRKMLEAILHPRIKDAVLARVGELNAPYCMIVVPLLIETNFNELVDKVLVVDAPDADRIGWIERRNGISGKDIKAIMSAQTSRDVRLGAADYVIVNNGTVEELEAKVCDLHRTILASCG